MNTDVMDNYSLFPLLVTCSHETNGRLFLSVLQQENSEYFFFFSQAIICGKVGQAPVQKILRTGKTVTIFTVGTGGMFDQRLIGNKDLPKPAQWHRIAVHNESLGAYAVQQLVKKYVTESLQIGFSLAACVVSDLITLLQLFSLC